MEIHVHSYLSRYFEIKTNEEGNDCVYYLDDKLFLVILFCPVNKEIYLTIV